MKILLLLTLCLSIPLSLSAESIGRIIKLHGTVYKFNAQKAEKKLVKKGDFIYRQDSLETSNASIVKVIMKDDTVFQLGPKSQFAFEKFKMRTKNDRDATYSLNYGQLRSLFTRKAPKRSLTIKARNVSMGIRGTEILTNVFKNEKNQFQTDIALLTGKLEIMQKVNNQVKKIFIQPGFQFSTKLIVKDNLKKAVKKLPSQIFAQVKRKKAASLQSFLPMAKTANNKFNRQLIKTEQMADKVFVRPAKKSKQKAKRVRNKLRKKYKRGKRVSSGMVTGGNQEMTNSGNSERVQQPAPGIQVQQPATGEERRSQTGHRGERDNSTSREIIQQPAQGHRGNNSSSERGHQSTGTKGKGVLKTIQNDKPVHKGQKVTPTTKGVKKQVSSTTKATVKYAAPKVKAIKKQVTPVAKTVQKQIAPATKKVVQKTITPAVKVVKQQAVPVVKAVVPQTQTTIKQIAKTIPKPTIQVPSRNSNTPVINKPAAPKKTAAYKKKPQLKKPKIQVKKKVRSMFKR